MSCSHNKGMMFQEAKIKDGDLVIQLRCLTCSADGSYTMDPDDVVWPDEEEHECDDTCGRHSSACDGNCYHPSKGVNQCFEIVRAGPNNLISNCLLAYTGSEFDPMHGPCQMCNGECPDKERLSDSND